MQKVSDVLWSYMCCLQVDAVVCANHHVVHKRHLGSILGKLIGLLPMCNTASVKIQYGNGTFSCPGRCGSYNGQFDCNCDSDGLLRVISDGRNWIWVQEWYWCDAQEQRPAKGVPVPRPHPQPHGAGRLCQLRQGHQHLHPVQAPACPRGWLWRRRHHWLLPY